MEQAFWTVFYGRVVGLHKLAHSLIVVAVACSDTNRKAFCKALLFLL